MKKKIIFGMIAIVMIGISMIDKTNFASKGISMNSLFALATVQAEDVWECKQPTKDKCDFKVTIDTDLGKLAKLIGWTPSIGITVDLSSATSLYSKGGTFRCGDDYTCTQLTQSLLN